MTLLDAIGAVLRFLGAFCTSPGMFMFYSVVGFIAAVASSTLAFSTIAEYDPRPIERIGFLALGIALILLSVAVAIWAGSAPGPVSWSK